MRDAMLQQGMSVAADTAVLMPDLSTLPGAAGPVVCVDIKPKAGFLPTTCGVHPNSRIKHSHSRYQLHQRLKVHQVCLPRMMQPWTPYKADFETQLPTYLHSPLPAYRHASVYMVLAASAFLCHVVPLA
jgi:Inositol-pentakisphosphate 2-kinase